MGKQFGFAMDANDEKRFLDMLYNEGQIYFSNSDKPLAVSDLREKWIKVLFYNSDMGELIRENILKDNTTISYIDSMESYVIEFCQTHVFDEDRRIARGRIFYDTSYWNKENVLIKKNGIIDKRFNQFKKWIKNKGDCILQIAKLLIFIRQKYAENAQRLLQ